MGETTILNWCRISAINIALLGTNICPQKGTLEDDFPFPRVGYVSSLEGTCFLSLRISYEVGTVEEHSPPLRVERSASISGTFAGVVKDAWRNHRVVGKDGKGNLLKG